MNKFKLSRKGCCPWILRPVWKKKFSYNILQWPEDLISEWASYISTWWNGLIIMLTFKVVSLTMESPQLRDGIRFFFPQVCAPGYQVTPGLWSGWCQCLDLRGRGPRQGRMRGKLRVKPWRGGAWLHKIVWRILLPLQPDMDSCDETFKHRSIHRFSFDQIMQK